MTDSKTPKGWHDCVAGIKELVQAAADDYKLHVIHTFAMHIFGDDYNHHQAQGKDLTILYIDRNFETIFELRRIKAIEYLIGYLQSNGSNWSGGHSVTNMMEQIKRDVILKYINNKFDTPGLVKKRMLEIVEEWE